MNIEEQWPLARECLTKKLQVPILKDDQNRGARIIIIGLKFRESVARVRPTWIKAIYSWKQSQTLNDKVTLNYAVNYQ